MKEAIIYGIISITSLILLGYTVHMFIGGIVSERTENIATVIVMLIGAVTYCFLAWDVIKRRRGLGR